MDPRRSLKNISIHKNITPQPDNYESDSFKKRRKDQAEKHHPSFRNLSVMCEEAVGNRVSVLMS